MYQYETIHNLAKIPRAKINTCQIDKNSLREFEKSSVSIHFPRAALLQTKRDYAPADEQHQNSAKYKISESDVGKSNIVRQIHMNK